MRHPALLTAVIYLAGLGAAGQFSKLAVSFLALSETYGGRETTLGWAISSISLVGVVLGLFAGMVVNRIGTRRALIGSLLLGALVSFWQASLPAMPWMIASRVIEGTSHLLIVVAAPTLIAETTPDRLRPAALTLWSTFFGVAFALLAITAPALIALGGLPALILSHGLWMAGAAALCALALPASAAYTAPPQSHGSILARHVTAYVTPGIAAPALAWLCYTLTFVSVLTVLPLLMGGAAPLWLGSAAPLVSIAVSLTAGVALLSRFRAWGVVIGGFTACLAAALGTLALGFTATTVLALFAAMAFVQGSGFALVPQLNPDPNARALANGAMAQMGNLGNLTGTPLLIALYTGAPVWGPFAFLALSYGAGIALTYLIGRRASPARFSIDGETRTR
ncbi:MFS transporter [Marivita sp. GX14005]|uniref:MFS transporter n=1 Tax=Marivita sp. GX14005 TaxID=2942276 RepID=UPI0020194CA8|nr:MFS transporter [Marivita sp. GX14005]MCL3881157.1 MFS transporter [Marivita sp. GX14005]